MFDKLDHIAIAVKDIDAVLPFWVEKMGLKVAIEEYVADKTIRLVHLNSGGCQIQLVQSMNDDHPIAQWVNEHGDGLHHLCFYVDEFDQTVKYAKESGMIDNDTTPHQGTDGKRAIFLSKNQTGGVVFEITGP